MYLYLTPCQLFDRLREQKIRMRVEDYDALIQVQAKYSYFDPSTPYLKPYYTRFSILSQVL